LFFFPFFAVGIVKSCFPGELMKRTRLVVCLVLLVSFAAAQQQPASPQEGHERILGVVPAFGVTNDPNAAPLTAKQKFKLFARSTYDPFTWAAAGLQSGIGQAQDSFREYGQGAEGYGKRFGAAMADSATSNFTANFLFPVLLKQDPRYFRAGEGSIRHRVGHSLWQALSTRTDKGTRQFNWSNVLGAVATGGVSNAYYPPSDRGFSLTMSRAVISLLYGEASNLASEFAPDVTRKLFHKRAKNGSGGAAQQQPPTSK
jgi:hypothetical protein